MRCHSICRKYSGNLIARIRHHGFTVSGLSAITEGPIINDLAVKVQLRNRLGAPIGPQKSAWGQLRI